MCNPPLSRLHLVRPEHSCQVAFTHGGEACLKQLLTSYKQDSLPFPLYPPSLSLSPFLSHSLSHTHTPVDQVYFTPLTPYTPYPFHSLPSSSSTTTPPPLRMWGPHYQKLSAVPGRTLHGSLNSHKLAHAVAVGTRVTQESPVGEETGNLP